MFTLPHGLNGWVQLHPKVIYALLFNAVSTTVKQFGRDPQRLNGEVGMTLVLHTWGQNLSQYVHLHCLSRGRHGPAYGPDQPICSGSKRCRAAIEGTWFVFYARRGTASYSTLLTNRSRLATPWTA